jgi:hypothetical protein
MKRIERKLSKERSSQLWKFRALAQSYRTMDVPHVYINRSSELINFSMTGQVRKLAKRNQTKSN